MALLYNNVETVTTERLRKGKPSLGKAVNRGAESTVEIRLNSLTGATEPNVPVRSGRGVLTSLRFLFAKKGVDWCYRDFSPIIPSATGEVFFSLTYVNQNRG